MDDKKMVRVKCASCGCLYTKDESNIYGICHECISKAVHDAWKETLIKLSQN